MDLYQSHRGGSPSHFTTETDREKEKLGEMKPSLREQRTSCWKPTHSLDDDQHPKQNKTTSQHIWKRANAGKIHPHINYISGTRLCLSLLLWSDLIKSFVLQSSNNLESIIVNLWNVSQHALQASVSTVNTGGRIRTVRKTENKVRIYYIIYCDTFLRFFLFAITITSTYWHLISPNCPYYQYCYFYYLFHCFFNESNY